MQNSTAISAGKQPATLATLAEQINAHHRQCESAMRSGLSHALEAGQLLAEAKTQCPHGTWGDWLAEHFEGSERTSQAYMRVARRWPELEANAKAQRVADLSLRDAIKLLTEPRAETPESYQRHIEELEEQFFGDHDHDRDELIGKIVGLVVARNKALTLTGRPTTPGLLRLIEAEGRVTVSILQTGMSLRWIRDRRSYRETHSDFHKFCEDQFEMDRWDVDWWIRAADGILSNRLGRNAA